MIIKVGPYGPRKGFEVEIGNEDLVTPSGLEFVGMVLDRINLRADANAILGNEENKGIKTGDCIAAFIGLLCQGKTSFEDVREMIENPEFYSAALGNVKIPSAEALRQRLDEIGYAFDKSEIAQNAVVSILKAFDVQIAPVSTGHLPVDCDVSPHDNSKTKKEGIGWTYKGFFGYSPIYAYLGEHMINCEFRNGEQHSQKNAVGFFEQTIRFCREVTDKPLLFRLDSGHDAADNVRLFIKSEGVDYIIARNLRSETSEQWLKIAENADEVAVTKPRDGKTVYVGSTNGVNFEQEQIEGCEKERIVFEVTVRQYKKDGQMLLTPEIEVSTWRTSLDSKVAAGEIIELYHQHAVCEQFHSELKTDIGLERFPSGKRATNAAILKIAMIAFTILRLIGEVSLLVGTGKQRHKVTRIRLKTVMQRFIFIATRVVRHAKKLILKLGRRDYWRSDFISIHKHFTSI